MQSVILYFYIKIEKYGGPGRQDLANKEFAFSPYLCANKTNSYARK